MQLLIICQLKKLVSDCNDAWNSLGKAGFRRSDSEKGSRKHRRSLYFMKDLIKGSEIKPADIRAIRPGISSPKFTDEIIGKRLSVDVERGDPVTFDAFCLISEYFDVEKPNSKVK